MKFIKMVFVIFFFLFLNYLLNVSFITNCYSYVLDTNYVSDVKLNYDNLESFNGVVTGYGPDCVGCSGITASEVDVRNTIYYNDKEYGMLRIVAADSIYPFGTIVRVTTSSDIILAIVLDRGGAIGNDKPAQLDLLFESEDATFSFGRQNANIEILRYGY